MPTLQQELSKLNPAIDSDFQHISEILPGVLASIFQAAASQQDNSRPEARSLGQGIWHRWAA
jgi:hypothetical protein